MRLMNCLWERNMNKNVEAYFYIINNAADERSELFLIFWDRERKIKATFACILLHLPMAIFLNTKLQF